MSLVLASVGTNDYVLLTSLLQLAVGSQGWSDHSCMRHLRYALILPDTSQKHAAMHWGSQLLTAVVPLAHPPTRSILLHILYCLRNRQQPDACSHAWGCVFLWPEACNNSRCLGAN